MSQGMMLSETDKPFHKRWAEVYIPVSNRVQ